jgi:hypothetical protein
MGTARRGPRGNLFLDGEELSPAGKRLLGLIKTQGCIHFPTLRERFRCADETIRNAIALMRSKKLIGELPRTSGYWGDSRAPQR